MKKKYIGLFLLGGLFLLTGCASKQSVENNLHHDSQESAYPLEIQSKENTGKNSVSTYFTTKYGSFSLTLPQLQSHIQKDQKSIGIGTNTHASETSLGELGDYRYTLEVYKKRPLETIIKEKKDLFVGAPKQETINGYPALLWAEGGMLYYTNIEVIGEYANYRFIYNGATEGEEVTSWNKLKILVKGLKEEGTSESGFNQFVFADIGISFSLPITFRVIQSGNVLKMGENELFLQIKKFTKLSKESLEESIKRQIITSPQNICKTELFTHSIFMDHVLDYGSGYKTLVIKQLSKVDNFEDLIDCAGDYGWGAGIAFFIGSDGNNSFYFVEGGQDFISGSNSKEWYETINILDNGK